MTTTVTNEPLFILELNRPFGDDTPWGKPDEAYEIAAGVWCVSTPSHGGYWLSNERYTAMPDLLKECSFTGDQWFEEDCAWVAVALAYPELDISTASTAEHLRYLPYALMGKHQLGICKSAAGYYIGRFSEDEEPISRDSVEYWQTECAAQHALGTGQWTLRMD